MGDCNGIGPEVILKSLTQNSVWRQCNPVVIGSIDVMAWYAQKFRMSCWLQEVMEVPAKFVRNVIPILPVRQFYFPKIQIGTATEESGLFASKAIEKAVELCQRGAIDGIVTAPVSKKAMDKAGYHYPGQTEMLASLTGSNNGMMILIANSLRVGLVTVHTALKKVSQKITKKLVMQKITTLYESLKKDFAVRTPKIAVLGLNPHAGEGGMLGDEELQEIIPAMRSAERRNISVEGPFSADGFFGSQKYREYDAVLAMYHDQGLIPLKMLGFEVGVNFSAGLPLVRTSPDHGTAFDIAGKGIANPSSTIEAMLLAAKIINHRKKQRNDSLR